MAEPRGGAADAFSVRVGSGPTFGGERMDAVVHPLTVVVSELARPGGRRPRLRRREVTVSVGADRPLGENVGGDADAPCISTRSWVR